MKILSAKQIKDCDHFTIKNTSVSSISLMERAAEACVDWISKNLYQIKQFTILSGVGNNGGDGFAIARLLKKKGFYVKVVTVIGQDFTSEATKNLKRIRENGDIEIIDYEKALDLKYEENSCVIDALFGTGLNRRIDGVLAKLIKKVNQLEKVRRIAVDIPSGLFANDLHPKDSVIFRADDTLTFQTWKRTFLHPETGMFAGKVHILDIKLSQDFIDKVDTDFYVNDQEIIQDFFKKREDFSHKGRFGKSAIVAGSYGKMGAAVLSVSAALRTGSGLVYSISADSGYHIMQTSNPEAMFIKAGEDFIDKIEVDSDFTTAIGPGLGTEDATRKAFAKFLKKCTKALVLDADALNIISLDLDLLESLPKDSVLTPHPKEFERIFGTFENSYERLEAARNAAEKYQIYIVLKDHRTQIITPDRKVYYNVTGNSGMAKGGSGDVLTGIITSLIAQNYTSLEATLLGVWLHGKAGDFATEKYSKESVLPSDLVKELGEVFKILND